MKYKYIFFDFNGTVIDDLDLCLDLLNQILIKQNKPTKTVEEYKEIFGFPIIDYYKAAGVTFEKDSFEDLSNWFIKIYQPESFKCSLFHHSVETFDFLRSKGYKVVLLSASQIDNLLEQCEAFGITKCFDDILGIEDVRARSKVHLAEAYFKKHNIDPKDAFFIGDTLHDAEVAKTVGADFGLVTFGQQSTRRLKQVTDLLFNSYDDIKEYLDD
jgi:phosphoglycolate phosphatase